MKRPIRFDFKNGRFAFLWPDHPLVMAGTKALDDVLNSILAGADKSNIVQDIALKYGLTSSDVTTYVEYVSSSLLAIDTTKQFGSPTAEPQTGLAMATLNITKSCNLACAHCYAIQDQPLLEMSNDDFRQAVVSLGHLITEPPKLLVISGGEPCLKRDRLLTVILTALEHGLTPRLNTNGYFIDNDLAQFLAEHHVLVQVSLDGLNAHTHALLRHSPDAYDKAVAAIQLLVSKGCRTRISCTVHDKNVSQIPALIQFAQDIGAEQFVTSSLVLTGNALTNRLTPIDFAEEFKILYNAVRFSVDKQRMTRSTLLGETITAIRSGVRFRYCGTGHSTCCVNADGRVYPCLNLISEDYCGGVITASDFVTQWKSLPAWSQLRTLDVSTMNPSCSKCMFRHFCGGFCRGETLSAGKTINAPYVRCASWKRGLLQVLDCLSETPDLYALGDFNNLILHRE